MPQWVIYSLLGTAITTAVIFVDKYNLTEQIKDYRGMTIYSAIVGLVAGTILWVLTGFPTLKPLDAFLVTLTGVLSISSASIYFYVIQRETGSKVIFLLQLIPIMVLILAVIFLKEALTVRKLAGFFLILIPSLYIAAMEEGKFKFTLNKNSLLLIVSNIIGAISAVLFKFVVDAGSFSKVVAYESWGWALGGLLLFVFIPGVRGGFIQTTKSIKKVALAIVFGNEILYVGCKLLFFLAISLGPVYLVNVISGTQVIFGVIYGIVLTLIAPRIFKEDLSRSGLLKKLGLGMLTLIGLTLVY